MARRGLLRQGSTKLTTSEQFANCGARRSIERMSCTEWSSEMIVGYSRVSTDGQTLDAQQAALRDTEVVDVFAPPRDGFLAEARRPICVHRSPRPCRVDGARESMRFTVPSLRLLDNFGPDAMRRGPNCPPTARLSWPQTRDVTGVVGRNCRRIRSTNRERCPRARSSHHVPVFERLAPPPLVLHPSGDYHPPTLSAATR